MSFVVMSHIGRKIQCLSAWVRFVGVCGRGTCNAGSSAGLVLRVQQVVCHLCRYGTCNGENTVPECKGQVCGCVLSRQV